MSRMIAAFIMPKWKLWLKKEKCCKFSFYFVNRGPTSWVFFFDELTVYGRGIKFYEGNMLKHLGTQRKRLQLMQITVLLLKQHFEEMNFIAIMCWITRANQYSSIVKIIHYQNKGAYMGKTMSVLFNCIILTLARWRRTTTRKNLYVFDTLTNQSN